MRTNIAVAIVALLAVFIAAHGSIGQGGTGGGASDFSELTGSATDAQIPNTITIDLAAKAGAFVTSTVGGLPGTSAVADVRYATDATTSAGCLPIYVTRATNTWAQLCYAAGASGAITVSCATAFNCLIDVDPAALVPTTVYRKRECDIVVGDTSGSAITDAQLGPQKGVCEIPAPSTLVQISVLADGGTPNAILQIRNPDNSTADLTSAALATAASGARACSNTGGTTGLDGVTTCSATLQNTSLQQGAYIELKSGTAGGVAKLFTIHAMFTIN